MRTEKEMYNLVINFAKDDERIRVVALNGSRTNVNAPKDDFQDYDVVYVVTEMESFINDPNWIDIFGKPIIIQTPEQMDMFQPTLGNWFSYLMLFEDKTRIDLILVPLNELDKYVEDDKLIKVLLDKDGLIPNLPPPTDMDYWVKKPSPEYYNDCCNEFWWLCTYVAKGLCRNELIYSIDHLNMLKSMLFIMLSWEVGIKTNFSKSMGKNYKYLKNYLCPDKWEKIMKTYSNGDKECIWESLWITIDLFRQSSKNIGKYLNVSYPDYDEKVSNYLNYTKEKYKI